MFSELLSVLTHSVLRPRELVAHACIWALVLASYATLFRAALTLQQPLWTSLVPRMFSRIAGNTVAGSGDCNSDFPAQQLGGSDADEAVGRCQLDASGLRTLLDAMGFSRMSSDEAAILLIRLDATGNGRLSWGELTWPILGDGRWALQVYLDRWQQTQTIGGASAAKANSIRPNVGIVRGFGLGKIQPISQFSSS